MKTSSPFVLAWLIAAITIPSPNTGEAADSLTPWTTEAEVPDNVVDLWKGIDFREDPLDTEVVKEWTEDGVVCRYVIFTVGTFKGETSRVAAFYTFPEGAEDAPAIVWAHGGGQRADLSHGKHVAKYGYAMIDYNWGGREMVEGIKANTDWGAVDPSQGPRFYPGAKREGTKLNLLPDEHTIDPVVSPRNGNWFLLGYAGRRAITFLEQQPEVDPDRIGFTGYSMGGNITSYASIDPRLKAVVPMVGGAGFITADSPGLPGSGMARAYSDHVELFAATMESQSYYPHTTCPVLLLSASDDFHARFEFIYRCMDALPHDDWRVSHAMHLNHTLGPEQWILLVRWFDKYLKGEPVEIPETPRSELVVDGDTATFTVTPHQAGDLTALDIYYSHDPNPKSRFWISADAVETDGTWSATLPVRDQLPLYTFANATYPLGEALEAYQGGTATQFSITSSEGVHLPESIDATHLFEDAKPTSVFSSPVEDGFRDWGFHPGGGLYSWKFRDPRFATPAPDAVMRVEVQVPRDRLSYRFRLQKHHYLAESDEPSRSYAASVQMTESGTRELLLKASDFTSGDDVMTDWANITTLSFQIYDGAAKTSLNLGDEANRGILRRITWMTE